MGEIKAARPVKLFAAMLAVDSSWFEKGEIALAERFGAIDLRSPDFPFRYTDYYAREMGNGLVKRLISFAKPFDPNQLSDAKIYSNAVESRFVTSDGKRPLNLDPGYLSESKIVLASTKDNAHRIPLRDGIFGEITMTFDGRVQQYISHRWTYPDYASGDFFPFFDAMREKYRAEIKP